MAARYWVGGTGYWNTTTTHWAASSGGAGGQTAPSYLDDVYFDLHSNEPTDGAYTVTIATNVNCNNINIANTGIDFVHIAGTTELNIYGNFNISSTNGVDMAHTGNINFKSTGACTISNATTGLETLASNIIFNSTGSWQLLGNFPTTGNITLTKGTLNTNGKILTGSAFSTAGTNTRVLTLGASTLNFATWTISSTTNLTFNYNTSIIKISEATFIGAGLTYYEVQLNSSYSITLASNTYTNLTRTAGATTNSILLLSGDQTITGVLTLNGNSAINRLFVKSDTLGTTRTLTAASVVTKWVDYQDITGAGAGNWDLTTQTTDSSGNCGGNTAITFTTPVAQHWVAAGGAGGNWSDVANWTSRIPLPQDDVYFNNAFGTSQTITANMPRLGKSIDWTGATWTTALTFTSTIVNSIFGSYILISGLTYTSNPQTLTLEGRGAFNLNSDTAAINQFVNINAIGGTYTLTGNILLVSTKMLTITNGTLDASINNYIISTGFLNVDTNGTLILRGGIHLLTGGNGTVFTGTGTISASTGTIKITNSSNDYINFAGGGKIYNNLWFSRGTSIGVNTISGDNTFIDFKDDESAAHSLIFTASSIQHVATFSVSGSSGNLITLNSTSTATFSLIKDGGGFISCNYLNIQHSVASPANTWYAGVNSIDNQAVVTAGSGWIFANPSTSQNSSVKTAIYYKDVSFDTSVMSSIQTAIAWNNTKINIVQINLEKNNSVKACIIVGTTREISSKASIVVHNSNILNSKVNILSFISNNTFARTNLSANSFSKIYSYKVFDATTKTYVTSWTKEVISQPTFTMIINGSPGEMQVKLARKFDSFGEDWDVKLFNKVECWCYDREAVKGVLIYSGYISGYKPVMEELKEYVGITLLPYGAELSFYMLRNGAGETTIAQNSIDPSTMFKNIIDYYRSDTGTVNYTTSTVDMTGTVVSYEFKTYTIKEALNKAIELTPYDWYWRVDADNLLYLKQSNMNVADHTFLIGKHINHMETWRRGEDIYNRIYFVGGETAGVALYRVYSNTASINSYGIHAYKQTDSRATVTGTADIMANRTLSRKQSPEIRTSITIVDSNGTLTSRGYDIESIKPGQTMRIRNIKQAIKTISAWDSMEWDVDVWDETLAYTAANVIQIQSVQYSPNAVIIQASSRTPDITKRIEDINRNLDDETAKNTPTTPTVV